MDLEVLGNLGLSEAEVQVYLALLQLGSVPSGKIVAETSKRKSTVYETLRRLQQRGLVSHIFRGGMKHFEAVSPDKLLDSIAERKNELERTEARTRKLVSELKKGFDILKPQAEAHVLEGIEGFKAMRRDVLRHAKGEHLLIGAISRENEVMPAFFKDWNRQRQKRRIEMRILHKESARGKAMSRRVLMGSYFETRFLPDELESPAVINIYGDRVVNVLWKGDRPLCFLLINEAIASSYRKYFSYLWKLAKS